MCSFSGKVSVQPTLMQSQDVGLSGARRLKRQLRKLKAFDRNEEETASPSAVPTFQPGCKKDFSSAGFHAPVRRYWPKSGSWVIAQ